MIVYLVPVGPGRFDLYSEAPDEVVAEGARTGGFFRRHAHAWRMRWHEIVHAVRHRTEPHTSRWGRWRDDFVRHLAESIAEQRTLWALRQESSVVAMFPSNLDPDRARSIINSTLTSARRYHVRWLVVDAVLLVGSGLLMLVPGPNLLAYYFMFRLVGHYLSWRGASQGLEGTSWTMQPEPVLVELGALAAVAREERRSRVEAIAARLNLPRLAAFFDRTAVRV